MTARKPPGTHRKVGRPRTTLASLPEDWEAKLQACGEEGGSATEARKVLGIGQSAWDTLLTDSPEFRQAVKNAEEACQVWWERTGRQLAKGGGGNAAIWIFNMKNRFGWRDKPDEVVPLEAKADESKPTAAEEQRIRQAMQGSENLADILRARADAAAKERAEALRIDSSDEHKPAPAPVSALASLIANRG